MSPATRAQAAARRGLVALALGGIVVPALALAPAQHPSSSARPHPAAGAHAAATAAEASALRIESCSQGSASMLAALDHGDYAAAANGFEPHLKAGMGPDQLRTAWTATTARLGRLVSRGPPQAAMYGNDPVIATLLRFEKGALVSQVTCGADGRIAGISMRPAEPAPGPAPASGD